MDSPRYIRNSFVKSNTKSHIEPQTERKMEKLIENIERDKENGTDVAEESVNFRTSISKEARVHKTPFTNS